MQGYFSIFMYGVLAGLVFSPGCSLDINSNTSKSVVSTPPTSSPSLGRDDFGAPSGSVEGEQLNVSVQAIERNLGKFNRTVPVRVVDNVVREGQALSSRSFWSGAIKNEVDGPVIEISRKALSGNADLRFYLAHVRMREREADLGCEAIRVGLAHYLRADDGFDEQSYKLYRDLVPLDLSADLDRAKLKSDWRYRDSARGSCWAAVYYLATKKGISVEQLLKLPANELPNPATIRSQVLPPAERL